MSTVRLNHRQLSVPVRMLLLMALSVLPLAGYAKSAVTVGVSILPQKYFVERIAGDKAKVVVMVGPGHNPATYEPKPRQLAQLEQATLYFLIGVPFETRWVNTFREINPALTLVPLSANIVLRPMSPNLNASDADREHDHSHGHEHGSMQDPHVWLNPRLVKHIAIDIKTALLTIDPDNREYYEAGYQKFIGELDTLDQDIRRQLAAVKNRSFMVYHPSWGYFADEYALRQIPIEVEGKQPGAKTLSRLMELAQKNQVKVIFVQPQFSDRDAKTVADQVGAKLLVVDPLAENYAENLQRVSRQFAEALQ